MYGTFTPPPSVRRKRLRSGFTLIELSIVLVIIGLVIGGVLVGKDLYASAQLNKQMAQLEEYKTAINAFRLKYECFPGDCNKATQFWGQRAASCSSKGSGIPATDTTTCNGNGDGRIDIYTVEAFTFWQHMANAGLIKGQYSSGGDGSYFGFSAGLNIPNSILDGGAISYGVSGNNETNYPCSQCFMVGKVSTANGNAVIATLFTNAQTIAIESKYDDGNAITGRIRDQTKWSQFPYYCVNAVHSAIYVTPVSGYAQPGGRCALGFLYSMQ